MTADLDLNLEPDEPARREDTDEYRLTRVYQLQAVVERRLEEHLASGEDVDPWDSDGETVEEHMPECPLCRRLTGILIGIDATLTILLEHDWGGRTCRV